MKSNKFCCPECIGDNHLRYELAPILSKEIGVCDYCGTKNTPLIEPKSLRDRFDLLFSIYQPSDHGKSLVELLKEDWQLFDHPQMDVANSKVLLADILDDGEVVRKSFSLSSRCHSEALKTWEDLREELMYKNRYFPNNLLLDHNFAELLLYFELDNKSYLSEWFRARTNKSNEPYLAKDLKAPPRDRASNGRANPAGIPYLYLASDTATAIAEIRPHAGNKVSVARFTIPPNLKIIDLRDPRKSVAPLKAYDENELEKLRLNMDFFVKLGMELSQPIAPEYASARYIPTQYVCEFIKNKAFDGVMYKSSVGNGINVAIFHPEKAIIHEINEHQIKQITVDFA